MSWFDRAVVGVMPYVPRPLLRYLSRPYIAGTSLDEAIETIRQLNARGMRATLDILGEHIKEFEQAESAHVGYVELLDRLKQTGVDSNVSVKLTQLGLTLDPEACYRHIRSLVVQARGLESNVRIDMEDSSCTDDTLDVYRRLRAEGLDNVGIVLQSMLRRTESDVEALADLRPNVRVCKGIYVEPERVAYQTDEEINASYIRVIRKLVDQGSYVAFATHDDELVEAARGLVHGETVGADRYEFQMLLGVREPLRDQIVAEGHPLRVYVPFGEQWYAYSLRRMRENPKIAGYVAKSILAGPFSRNGH